MSFLGMKLKRSVEMIKLQVVEDNISVDAKTSALNSLIQVANWERSSLRFDLASDIVVKAYAYVTSNILLLRRSIQLEAETIWLEEERD